MSCIICPKCTENYVDVSDLYEDGERIDCDLCGAKLIFEIHTTFNLVEEDSEEIEDNIRGTE